MKHKKIPINVRLRSTIFDEEGTEHHEVTGKGEFLSRGNFEVLSFTEKLTDNERIKHFITIRDGQVHIKQSGARRMNQQFKNQQKTESMIRLPQGNLYLEIFTERINVESITKNRPGRLTIHYRATIHEQITRKHQLVITFHKEDVT